MNKSRMHVIVMKVSAMLLFTVFLATSAEAQTETTRTESRNDASHNVASTPRLKLTFAPKRTMLMPASAQANVSGPISNVMPTVRGPEFQVLGAGTVGKLTRWVEITNNKAYIGDSSIFEDAHGSVFIGTTFPFAFIIPTAKVTVIGATESGAGRDGGSGIVGLGAQSGSSVGAGYGVAGRGGVGNGRPLAYASAGTGVYGAGGDGGTYASGGNGVVGRGGLSSPDSNGASAGTGVTGYGGNDSPQSGVGFHQGGVGVLALGGTSSGSLAGDGLVAMGGSGFNDGAPGRAAVFLGDVVLQGSLQLQGNLNATGTKNFRIDHPLDPENKYLVHAAIESSEVLNIYSGNAVTNSNGEAIVTLPEWFEAVNSDFRYQLTVIGSFAQAIIAGEVKDHKFAIKSNAPQVRVSWQVTGVRSDPGMLKHPFNAEEDKPERERGTYLVPETYHQPEERSTEWARNPKLLQEVREMRSKLTEDLKPKTQRDNH